MRQCAPHVKICQHEPCPRIRIQLPNRCRSRLRLHLPIPRLRIARGEVGGIFCIFHRFFRVRPPSMTAPSRRVGSSTGKQIFEPNFIILPKSWIKFSCALKAVFAAEMAKASPRIKSSRSGSGGERRGRVASTANGTGSEAAKEGRDGTLCLGNVTNGPLLSPPSIAISPGIRSFREHFLSLLSSFSCRDC